MTSFDWIARNGLTSFTQIEDNCFSAMIGPGNLVEKLNRLKEEDQFLILFNQRVKSSGNGVKHLFLDLYNPMDKLLLTLEVPQLDEKPFLELKNIWNNLALHELEARDLENLDYKRVKESIGLFSGIEKSSGKTILQRSLPHRPLKDLGNLPRNIRFHQMINPKLWGVKLLLDMDLEKIYQSLYFYGNHHLGIEKQVIGKDFHDLQTILSGINTSSSIAYQLALITGVERKLKIKVSTRTIASRMILMEMERMLSHLQVLKGLAWEVEDQDSLRLLQSVHNSVEQLLSLLIISGLQLKLGAMKGDLSREWIEKAFRLLKLIEPDLEQIESKLLRSHHLKNSSALAPVNLKDCINWGCSGPVARATGVRLDWRVIEDTGLYKEVNFETILLKNGSTQDRFLIRSLEIEQSRSIIVQLLENLPFNEASDVSIAESNWGLENLKLKSTFETPEGLLQLYVEFDSESKVGYCRVVGPSYSNTQLMVDKLKGVEFSQLEKVILSFNPNNFEIDR